MRNFSSVYFNCNRIRIGFVLNNIIYSPNYILVKVCSLPEIYIRLKSLFFTFIHSPFSILPIIRLKKKEKNRLVKAEFRLRERLLHFFLSWKFKSLYIENLLWLLLEYMWRCTFFSQLYVLKLWMFFLHMKAKIYVHIFRILQYFHNN